MTDFNSLESSSLLKIKQALDKQFGESQWVGFEPETVSMEFGEDLTPLLIDKICLLHILSMSPLKVFEDPSLFLYAAEVINNTVANFDSVPHITLLEAAYAIHSVKQVLVSKNVSVEFPYSIQKTIAYILRMEGCSEPISPFDFVDSTELVEGQTTSDTKAKKEAVKAYIEHMDSL